MSVRLAAAAVLLCATPAAAAGDGPVSASGYLKELWQYSHSAFDGRPYFLNTDRARLTLDGREGALRAHLDYDQEILAGSFFRTTENRIFGLGEAPTWLTADQTLRSGDTWLWRHRLHRGWAGVESDRGALLFGRQRIAWGTGKLWNPTDVLNPYQPLSVERDERRGVDALYGRYGLGALTQAELAWTPQDVVAGQALLGRLKTNAAGYDWSLMAGKVAASTGSWMAGGDFAGDLGGGTLHGEWSYTDRKVRTPFWKADLGYDYTFPSDTRWPGLKDATTVVEYLHSGSGVTDTTRYNVPLILAGQEVTLAQDYVGATYSRDVHPLLKVELVLIANANDGSQFFSPSATWNALNNLYLTAAFQRFGGPKRTELGRAANLVYLQAQYFF